MQNFGCGFLVSNLTAVLLVGAAALASGVWKRSLTARMRYGLWMAVFMILTVPFLPVRFEIPVGVSPASCASDAAAAFGAEALDGNGTGALRGLHDFAVEMRGDIPRWIGTAVFIAWGIGLAVCLVMFIKNMRFGRELRQSAVPVENREMLEIYDHCLRELGIRRKIPLLETAYLKSPVIIGVLRPGICLPLRLVRIMNADFASGTDEEARSGCRQKAVRYMLLHELQHYRHRDNLVNLLAEIIRMIYWFNPAVRYAATRLRTERETACDEAVLNMLEKEEYSEYAGTLLDLASLGSSRRTLAAAGISSGMKEMKTRICNIAGFRKSTGKQKAAGIAVFCMVTILLGAFIPFLGVRAGGENRYETDISAQSVTQVDLSAYFGGEEGCFVLYKPGNGQWSVYNEETALTRISPLSTWKIYDALLGLEDGIITPENSDQKWDGTGYPIAAWEEDQDLAGAIQNSVNWYFQNLDRSVGRERIETYLEQIGYGNQHVGADLESYWLDSSLAISPMEQVEMIRKFYDNTFGFAEDNVRAVKQAMYVGESDGYSLYGKTGTGAKDGNNVCGWFVGYAETEDGPCFFASLLQGESGASGARAAQITEAILGALLM